MRGDVRYVRAHPQTVAGPAGRPGAVPAVHQDHGEAVRALGGGQRGHHRPQQLRTAAARRPLHQQVRAVGHQIRVDRAARTGPEYRPGPPAQRPGVVGRVRPTGLQRRRGGPGQPQLVQQPRRQRQRRRHARGPRAGRLRRRPQGRQRPREPLRPGGGDGVHHGDRAGRHRPPLPGARGSHPHQPQRRRHVPAQQCHRPALAEHRRGRAGRRVRLRHRRGGRGGRRLGQAHHMDPGPGALQRQPRQRLPRRGAAGVAVHDHHRVRPGSRARVGGVRRGVALGPRGAVAGGHGGRGPVGSPGIGEVVVQAAQQFLGAGRGLVAVEGQEQPAVLAVPRPHMGQPAEPGPLRRALLERTGPVRAHQDDLQQVRRVQRGELGQHRAGQPGQAGARPGQAQRAHLAQPGGHRDRGQQPPRAVGGRAVGRAQPYRQRLRVVRPALPQPGARAQGGQQQRRRVRPGLRQRRGRHPAGHLLLRAARVRAVVRPAAARRVLSAPAGQAARPGTEPAAPAQALGGVGAAQGGALAAAGVAGAVVPVGVLEAVGVLGAVGLVRVGEGAEGVRGEGVGGEGVGAALGEVADAGAARVRGTAAVALDAGGAPLGGHQGGGGGVALCGGGGVAGRGGRWVRGARGRGARGRAGARGRVHAPGRARAGRGGARVRVEGRAGAGGEGRARTGTGRLARAHACASASACACTCAEGGARAGVRAPAGAGVRHARVCRAVPRTGCVRARRRTSRRRRGRAAHAHMALAVRCRRHAGRRSGGRRQTQGRLADAQQRARGEADRARVHGPSVQHGAVGGAEVGDRDPAVGGDRDRAVHPGDVGVVERYVGVGGAADGDLPAVQQVHAARVRPRHHVQPGGGLVQLGVRLGLGRCAQGQHRAVQQRRLAERAALGVEPLGACVEHHRARAGFASGPALGAAFPPGPLGRRRPGVPGDRRGERRRHRGQRRARGRRDEHVAARGGGGRAQGVYDGQPDLHRRQRSLLFSPRAGRDDTVPRSPHHGHPPPPHEHVGQYGGILAPAADTAPAAHRQVILIGRLCPQKCLTTGR